MMRQLNGAPASQTKSTLNHSCLLLPTTTSGCGKMRSGYIHWPNHDTGYAAALVHCIGRYMRQGMWQASSKMSGKGEANTAVAAYKQPTDKPEGAGKKRSRSDRSSAGCRWVLHKKDQVRQLHLAQARQKHAAYFLQYLIVLHLKFIRTATANLAVTVELLQM